MKTYLNSVNHFYNYVKIVKNEVNRQFPLSNLQELEATIKMWNKNLYKKKQRKESMKNSLKTLSIFH